MGCLKHFFGKLAKSVGIKMPTVPALSALACIFLLYSAMSVLSTCVSASRLFPVVDLMGATGSLADCLTEKNETSLLWSLCILPRCNHYHTESISSNLIPVFVCILSASSFAACPDLQRSRSSTQGFKFTSPPATGFNRGKNHWNKTMWLPLI